ncbi:hypothetical protein TNCV_3467331 [Trichonephila clavipes]|nr:hypothetical protein TNCV_3467331 [Trichonephila clavipes]
MIINLPNQIGSSIILTIQGLVAVRRKSVIVHEEDAISKTNFRSTCYLCYISILCPLEYGDFGEHLELEEKTDKSVMLCPQIKVIAYKTVERRYLSNLSGPMFKPMDLRLNEVLELVHESMVIILDSIKQFEETPPILMMKMRLYLLP